jgi:hypothetical protein
VRGVALLILVAAACSQAKRFEEQDLGGPDLSMPDLSMPDLMPCPNACPMEGAQMCMGTSVRVCMQMGSCLSWSPPSDCGADRICCANACVDVDVTHCYACAIACGTDAPVCSGTLKKCACTPASCAASNRDCDATSGGCVTCQPPPAPETRSDFYVDGAAGAVATGSQGCPYKTIADALAAATQSSAAQKTIHIAAGTYSTAETFPIVLRQGISLVGAGATTTTITGEGLWNGATAHSQQDAMVKTTIVVGSDGNATNTISGLTLLPASTSGAYGVFCDRGNAPPIANPVAAGFPAANVTLKGLTLGPAYDFGILATNSKPDDTMVDSGCNLLVLGSTFTGDAGGIWAVGCGINHPGTSAHTVAVQIGDNLAKDANIFTKLHNPGTGAFPSGGNNGTGLHAWDCVSPIRVLNNKFDDTDGALIFAMHSRDHVVDIENNTMSNLSNYGVETSQNMQIDQFIGNTLTNIGQGTPPAPNAPFSHAGLSVGTTGQVMKARKNVFQNNYIGVEITGCGMGGSCSLVNPPATRSVIDFGTAADPGNNTFACNSHASNAVGYDVWIHLSSTSDPALAMAFAGNAWNRDGVSATAGGTDGNDLVVTTSTGTAPTVDTSGQKTSVPTCTGGRVP